MKNSTLQLQFYRQMAMGISVSTAIICALVLILASLSFGGLFAPVFIGLSIVAAYFMESAIRYCLTKLIIYLL